MLYLGKDDGSDEWRVLKKLRLIYKTIIQRHSQNYLRLKSAFKLKNTFLSMFSRHLFLLASSCRREKSNGGNVFFIVIQKKGGQVLFLASFKITNTFYARSTAHAVILRFHMFIKECSITWNTWYIRCHYNFKGARKQNVILFVNPKKWARIQICVTEILFT